MSDDDDERRPFKDRPWDRQNGKEENINFGYSSNFNPLSNLTQLSRETQQHLQNVYGNLTITTLAAAAAMYLVENGFIMQPGSIATILMVIFLLTASLLPDTSPRNNYVRHGALYGFGFAQGWIVSPLVSLSLAVDPAQITMVTVATMLIFASFSMSAYYSPRRQYLYLGGLLASGMLIMMLTGFANAFLGSSTLFNFEIYLGLLIFALYVLYDTQVIVERSEGGSRDSVTHAIMLFTDVFAIFVRLLVLFTKDHHSNDERRQKRRK